MSAERKPGIDGVLADRAPPDRRRRRDPPPAGPMRRTLESLGASNLADWLAAAGRNAAAADST